MTEQETLRQLETLVQHGWRITLLSPGTPSVQWLCQAENGHRTLRTLSANGHTAIEAIEACCAAVDVFMSEPYPDGSPKINRSTL